MNLRQTYCFVSCVIFDSADSRPWFVYQKIAIFPNKLLFQCQFPVISSRYCAFFDRNLALSVAFCILSVSVALALAINQ